MDNKLLIAREKINEIDREMRKLFVERMKASELVAEYKQEHGLEILDPIREAEVIRHNSESVENDVYREYYVNFLNNTMAISRSYQAKLMSVTQANHSNTEGADNNLAVKNRSQASNTIGYENLNKDYSTVEKEESDFDVLIPENICNENEDRISHLMSDSLSTTLNINLGSESYPITIGREIIEKANEYFDLNRRVFIITDTGVPNIYAETVAKLCKNATIYTVAKGEGSKSLSTLNDVLIAMSEAELGRSDCVVAVGGGVVGDLSGFAASIYMRGIDFYNIPTTLLSQVDSSIGGKTAVNLGGIKNIVGSFKQPKAVLIDTSVLSTLPTRQMRNGLCEAIKMAATSNATLFERLESMSEDDIYNNIEEIIVEALKIKKTVVEEDAWESGVRKILNFGHTLGHGIEANEDLHGLYHGECVSLGMLPVIFGEAKERLIKLLNKVSLPTEYQGDISAALSYVTHDKKCSSGTVSVIICEKIGTCKIEAMSIDQFKNIVFNHYNCI